MMKSACPRCSPLPGHRGAHAALPDEQLHQRRAPDAHDVDAPERVSTVQPHPAPGQATPARTQDRMWHDVGLPEDVAGVRQLARDAVATHLAPARARSPRPRSPATRSRGGRSGLAADGCFAVPFPEPHGAGLEHPMLGTCIVTEEIAYESSAMAGVYDGQCILNARALSFARPEVRDQRAAGADQRRQRVLVRDHRARRVERSHAVSDEDGRAPHRRRLRPSTAASAGSRTRSSPTASPCCAATATSALTFLLIDMQAPGVTRRRAGPQDGPPRPDHRRHRLRGRRRAGGERARRAGQGPRRRAGVAGRRARRHRRGGRRRRAGGAGPRRRAAAQARAVRQEAGGDAALAVPPGRARHRARGRALACTRRPPCGWTAATAPASPRRRWPSPSPRAWPTTWPATRCRSTAATDSPHGSPRPARPTAWRRSTATPRSSRSSRAPTRSCSGSSRAT